MDLFDNDGRGPDSGHLKTNPQPSAPLAERMRPRSLDEVLGQAELTSAGGLLRVAFESDRIGSMILWGPPGSGKTSMARLLADRARARFISFSAVLSGIKEIKEIMAAAERGASRGPATVLFIDEIHRFNRAQQDAFLPSVERGTIVLVGATTENPSFSVNAALLSRCAVLVLRPLEEDDLVRLLRRALEETRGLGGRRLAVEDTVLHFLASRSGGDARRALNALETAVLVAAPSGPTPTGAAGGSTVTREHAERALQRAALLYDKAGEEHFNLISALHKSLRNSDADAAVYWLVRMLESGEDPLYVARRMIRFASEDVGNADPGALRIALLAREAFESLGMPEGGLALVQAAIYLAAAPKSNSVHLAYGKVVEDLRNGPSDPVPEALRNAATDLMRDLGYGSGYRSAHDLAAGTAHLECLPERLRGRTYYEPRLTGFERALALRLKEMSEARARLAAERPPPDPIRRPPRPRSPG